MNKRHYEHTLPNIRGSLSNTYIWWDKQPSDSYRRFYPIPARAISANPLLKRSEGYIY